MKIEIKSVADSVKGNIVITENDNVFDLGKQVIYFRPDGLQIWWNIPEDRIEELVIDGSCHEIPRSYNS